MAHQQSTYNNLSGTTTAGSNKTFGTANTERSYLFIQNVGATDIWVRFGGVASAAAGSAKIVPNGDLTYENAFVMPGQINIFCSAAQDVTIWEA